MKGDPNYGFVDTSALPVGFAPRTDKALCPKGRCYPAQQGYAHGQAINFINLFAFPSAMLAMDAAHKLPIATLVATEGYEFANGCTATATYDPRSDAFRPDAQYPIFSKFPSAMVTYPFVARHTVSNTAGIGCNLIKTQTSLKNGAFGATIDAAVDYRLWTIVDPTASFGTLKTGEASALRQGWFNGLQLAFLDSGAVPTDGNGNLVAQQGALINPTSGTAKVTDAKVIVLSKAPGEDGYSPIVALQTFALPAGKMAGDYTGICDATNPASCGPNDAALMPGGAADTTLLIYAP